MNAKVLLRGERVRVESQNGQQKVVMLWIKPYAYRLLPASKAGVRTRTKSSDSQLQGLPNWPQLLNNPARLRKALAAQGARKTGTATVNGVATDVYFAKNWQSMSTPAGNVKLQNVRIWLRRADALPVKMESKTGDWKIALTWNNYKRNPNLAASLFEVPKGYRIRETAGR